MNPHTCRTKLWNITCYFIPALMFGIDITEGIKWIKTPSQLSKCTGQTANLTWEYEKEPNEEIRQLQWRFNTTTVIAYHSEKNGFSVHSKYQGRVEQISVAGILLKNISSKDTGNYTLYPVISWKESQIIRSIFLNVIEVTMQQWCTCEGLSLSPVWSGGRNVSIVTDGCHLEIHSSRCCIKGPAIECMENDPQKLCVPVTKHTNMNENTSPIASEQTASTDVPKGINPGDAVNIHLPVVITAMVSFLVVLSILVVCCLFLVWRRIRQGHYCRKMTDAKDYSTELLQTNTRLVPVEK